MHKILEKLKRDHRNLEKILTLLTTHLDHFFAGSDSNFDLIIELMEYLEAFADQGHHRLENIIFEVAMERMEDHRVLFECLGKQHKDLDYLTRTFRQSLEGVIHETVMSREELETQGREYIALQHLHLDVEEREAFPLLNAGLTKDEWECISANMPKYDDPVFGTPDQKQFQNLVAYLYNEKSI